jgi:hypothetical protein
LPPGAEDRFGESVEQHPLFGEIRELLRYRFSAETIVGMMRWQYGQLLEQTPLPSARTITRWRDRHMPPGDIMPAGLVERKLKDIEVKVDLFRSLQQVYRLAEDRLSRATETEEGLPAPMPGVDKAVETLLRVGDMFWKVGQDLGIYPRSGGGGAQFGVFIPVGTPPLGEPTDDEITAVVAAVFQKRTGRELPQLGPVIEGEARVLD